MLLKSPTRSRIHSISLFLKKKTQKGLSGYVPGIMRFPEPGTEKFSTMLAARTQFFDKML